MKTMFSCPSALAAAVLCLAQISFAQTRDLSRAELLDRIRGGWAGQMIGVAYGAPTEFKSNGLIGEWDLEWKPGMLENTLGLKPGPHLLRIVTTGTADARSQGSQVALREACIYRAAK